MKSRVSEQELTKRLTLTIAAIVAIVVLVLIGFSFFAPKIGSLFGFLSIHRNENDGPSKIKPNSPIFTDIPESTKEKEINLNGYSQPGTTVVLFVNGPEKQRTTSGADGLFTFLKVKLMGGRNVLFAKAVDNKGVESDNTNTYIIDVDSKDPEIEINSPKEGDIIKNLDKRIKISGKINEKSVITINERLVVQKPDLSFEFLLGVEEGTVEIKVVATDMAGNKSDKKINVSYEKKSG